MKYDILDNDFQQRETSAYQLSILARMDSLVYSVFNTADQSLLALKTIDLSGCRDLEAVGMLLKKENILDLLYRRVKIGIFEPRTALVPGRLFNKQSSRTYLEELSDGPLPNEVENDELEEMALQIVYPGANDLSGLLKRKFPTARIYNTLTPFLLGCKKWMENEQKQAVFAHFFDETFYLAVLEKNELKFCNAFKYATASDVLYFTLLTFEQLGLDTNEAPLNLSGKVLEESEIFKMLFRYVGNIDFMPLPGYLKFGRKFSGVTPHFYTPLYALSLCK